MTTRRSCSWCDTMNVLTGGPVACIQCGHRGDVCRLDCDCPKCRRHLRESSAEAVDRGQKSFLDLLDGDD